MNRWKRMVWMAVAALAVAALAVVTACSMGSGASSTAPSADDGSPSSASVEAEPEIVQYMGDDQNGRVRLNGSWERRHRKDGNVVFYDGATGTSLASVDSVWGTCEEKAAEWAAAMGEAGIEVSVSDVEVRAEKAVKTACDTNLGRLTIYWIDVKGEFVGMFAFVGDEAFAEETMATYEGGVFQDKLGDADEREQWVGDDRFGYLVVPASWDAARKSDYAVSLDYYDADDFESVYYGPTLGDASFIEMYDPETKRSSGPVIQEFVTAENKGEPVLGEEQLDTATLTTVTHGLGETGAVMTAYTIENEDGKHGFLSRYADNDENRAAFADVAKSLVVEKPGTNAFAKKMADIRVDALVDLLWNTEKETP